MLLPVVLGLNPAVVIPPSTETEQGKTVSDSDIDNDHSQLKNPPEKGMLMLVDPALVNSPSTETENKSIEPAIAPESQLATAVSSNIPVANKSRQGQQLPMRPSKSNKLTCTSLSVPKPATNKTQNDSTVEYEDEEIHEEVSADPNYYEQSSYNEMYAIMPRFKPINDRNKDIGVNMLLTSFPP